MKPDEEIKADHTEGRGVVVLIAVAVVALFAALMFFASGCMLVIVNNHGPNSGIVADNKSASNQVNNATVPIEQRLANEIQAKASIIDAEKSSVLSGNKGIEAKK